MKNFSFVICGLLCSFILSSCGSLNQHVGGERLSETNIEFAKDMIAEPDWSPMQMTFDNVDQETDKWNSKLYPFPPVFFWTTLGSFNTNKQYGVRKVSAVFPAFYVKRDSIYTEDGLRRNDDFEFNLLFAIWFKNYVGPKRGGWKFGLIYLPVLGPFLGFGKQYFQLFWIPFSDMD